MENNYQEMSDRLDVLIHDEGHSICDAYGQLSTEYGHESFNWFVQQIKDSLNDAPIIIY